MKDAISNIVKNKLRDVICFHNQVTCVDMYYLAATLDQLSNINLWWVDEVKILNDSIEISGWAIVPYSRHNNVAFTVNNVLFDEIKYPICNPGLAKIYYFKPNSAMCGFNCIKYTKGTNLITNDNLLICGIVDKKTLVPLDGYYNIHSQIENMDDLPMPNDKNLVRIGAQSLQHYKSVGFDKFMRLQEVLKQYVNKTYSDMERILDWGCGCGQVLILI